MKVEIYPKITHFNNNKISATKMRRELQIDRLKISMIQSLNINILLLAEKKRQTLHIQNKAKINKIIKI